MSTVFQGRGGPISIGPGDPARIIGERINPSGRPRLRQALLDRDWETLTQEAARQVEAGADILDVNVGAKGIDEVSLLPEVVRRVAEAVEVPLSIDTRNPAALEAALEICPGRPLVNSIGGEEKILRENLPIAAKFGVPIIVLCMGQEGIPGSAGERLAIAQHVLEAAIKLGVKEEDVIFDPLVMTVGAGDQAARLALETCRRLRETFPRNNITGGASNVSFGMPARPILNAHFLSAAFAAGMNLPITDPTDIHLRYALHCGNILLGRDPKVKGFMGYYRTVSPQ